MALQLGLPPTELLAGLERWKRFGKLEEVQAEVHKLRNCNGNKFEAKHNSSSHAANSHRQRCYWCFQYHHMRWRRWWQENRESTTEIGRVLWTEEKSQLREIQVLFKSSRKRWNYRPVRNCIEKVKWNMWIWNAEELSYQISNCAWSKQH